MKTLNSIFVFLFLVAQGFVFALAGFGSSHAFASTDVLGPDIYGASQARESISLAQHGGRGKHCPDMSHQGGCSGGKGRGHRGGMGRGMHHGGGQSGPAQCPQPRATVKAPEEFYNLKNPVESTPDNIEKGRLLFQLDAQPTCVMCHGNQGDGTGGFGANLSPSPRNFTCSETMKDISDGQLFWIIRNGSPDTGMPPFQGLQDEQIWNLIIFIRSLDR